MKKINLKKALASVAALSAVACMAAVPASAATNEFAASSKPSVAIEQVTLTLDEVSIINVIFRYLQEYGDRDIQRQQIPYQQSTEKEDG